jgi:hypothetical protein
MMKSISRRKLMAFCWLLFVIGLLGCTTNITPPSGPAGTEVCFDPAPIAGTQFNPGGDPLPCGWWVYFQSGDTSGSTYTWESCVDIPEHFVPGDEIFIRINGDDGGIKCHWVDEFQLFPWVPGYTLFGSFVVTE